MGILDLMLGRSAPGEQGVESQSYTLPTEHHDFVYPVAVRREEVDAFHDLLRTEADTPYLEDEADAGELDDVLEGILEEGTVDAEALAERMRGPRLAIEPVVESWRDRLERDIGVVYLRPERYEDFLAFVKICKQRDERASDPFDLPETFPEAAALLKRLEEATDDQYRAVVHADLLPTDD